jgi:hypothetical protein
MVKGEGDRKIAGEKTKNKGVIIKMKVNSTRI